MFLQAKEKFTQAKNALLDRWPWLGGFVAQMPGVLSAIAFAYVGVSLSLGSREESPSWFVSTLPGVAFMIATIFAVVGVFVNARRNRSIRSLQEQVGRLQRDLEGVRDDYHTLQEEIRGSHYALCSSELTSILRKALGYSDTERISAYRHRESIGAFQLIGRYSEDPKYNQPGRPMYPEDQGVIRDAWRDGDAVASLPDPETNEEGYYQEQKDEWNIDRSTADSFTMKSREYVACALYEPKGEHRVAVVVVESVKVGILDKDRVLEVIGGEDGESLYDFLETMRPIEPDLRLPIEEGF